jgi:FMNH2-dependent dimethyl sulfone monooxygenase
VPFDVHDARYARTEEWLTVLLAAARRADRQPPRRAVRLEGCVMEPKPSVLPTGVHGR